MRSKVKRIFAVSTVLLLGACGPAPETGAALESSEMSSSSIIGGKEVVGSDAAALTTVAVYDTGAKAICTGSLIGSNIVLTAAHCLGADPRRIVVVFSNNISKATAAMARPVVGAIAHPLYKTNRKNPTNTGDIALIKYQGATPAGYRPVNILPNISLLRNGAAVLLAGYGISDGVKKTGSGVLRQVVTTIANAKFSNTELSLEQRQGRGACHGDSGGPAYVVANGVNYLWGVTSRGNQDPKDHCSVFSIYTNVLAYSKWLQDTARSLAITNQFNTPQTERTFGRGIEF